MYALNKIFAMIIIYRPRIYGKLSNEQRDEVLLIISLHILFLYMSPTVVFYIFFFSFQFLITSRAERVKANNTRICHFENFYRNEKKKKRKNPTCLQILFKNFRTTIYYTYPAAGFNIPLLLVSLIKTYQQISTLILYK